MKPHGFPRYTPAMKMQSSVRTWIDVQGDAYIFTVNLKTVYYFSMAQCLNIILGPLNHESLNTENVKYISLGT